ncbi:hypothetical protein C8Q74DRAFT_1291398 [Fomes fomentarius]|nr:hypothetical protein C8Q74DRAFT_1291398 [Fomes fomentarius]
MNSYQDAQYIEARKALYTREIGTYMLKQWCLVYAKMEYQAESPPSRFVESSTAPRDTEPSSRQGASEKSFLIGRRHQSYGTVVGIVYVHDYAQGPRPRHADDRTAATDQA